MTFQKKQQVPEGTVFTQVDLMTNTQVGRNYDDAYKVGKNCDKIEIEGDWVIVTQGREHRRVHASLVRSVLSVDPE